jgi:hypothetical protein
MSVSTLKKTCHCHLLSYYIRNNIISQAVIYSSKDVCEFSVDDYCSSCHCPSNYVVATSGCNCPHQTNDHGEFAYTLFGLFKEQLINKVCLHY